MRLVGKIRQRARARARAALVGPFNPTPGWQYFHGSRSGLVPGTILLPARERGDRRSELSNAKAGYDQFSHHPDWVFVTDDPCLALAFAGRRHKPAVYEVEPIGELAEDEDAPGQSWMCTRAKIVRQVPVPPAVLRELHACKSEPPRPRGRCRQCRRRNSCHRGRSLTDV